MSTLYKEAAELLAKLEQRKGGLKSLAYDDNVVHKRSSFALVCETLRYKPLLQQLLAAVPKFQFQHKAKGTTAALLYVSLYDFLFGRKKVQGGGHLKKELMQFGNAFREAVVRMKIKAKVSTDEELLPLENRKQDLKMPRYVRLNRLLISDAEVNAFVEEFQAKVDDHVRDLLVLPSGTELHEHALVAAGKIVLQDKASCFPAFVLHGEHNDSGLASGGDVIDACAAPGNKTSHVAMLLHQQQDIYDGRKVFAFDRSPKRLDLLKRRMELAGASQLVEPCLQSFLDIDVNDEKYRNVGSVLLDPSCSGSGMTNRLDHLLDIASGRDKALEPDMDEYEVEMANRLQSLADFQLQALLKAFSFPHVERVVYSTCSIFEKEDEEVVVAALTSEQNKTATRPFELRPCLVNWPRRGKVIEGLSGEQAAALVRANGLEDATNGFFVAYFERANVGAVAPTESTPSSVTGPQKKRKRISEAQKEKQKQRKREKKKKKANETQ